MACFDDENMRAQRRSFMSSNDCSFPSSNDEDNLMFEQVSNYVSIKPAWLDSSRALQSRNLEHKLCECDSTIAKLVGVRNDWVFAPSTLLRDIMRLPTALTRRRPHRAHRYIAESLATMPTILGASR